MMWSFPIATSAQSLPRQPVVDSQGHIDPRAYMYNLAEIATRVLDFDNLSAFPTVPGDILGNAIGIDKDLQLLAGSTPPGWWKGSGKHLSIDALLQYWHLYFTVRTHLRLAMSFNGDDTQFALNLAFNACFRACRELCERYVSLRPMLPVGFFANGIIDLQVFTALVFLVLASHRAAHADTGYYRSTRNDLENIDRIVSEAVRGMQHAAEDIGKGFAQQAVRAIRSLSTLLATSPSSKNQQITLSLPLVGKIHLSYKAGNASSGTVNTSVRNQWPVEPIGDVPLNDNVFTSSTPRDEDGKSPFLSYSMEIPGDYAFLADTSLDYEFWQTQMGSTDVSLEEPYS